MSVNEIWSGDSGKFYATCLSTDTKPSAASWGNGSVMVELDTGRRFLSNGTSWVQQGSAVANVKAGVVNVGVGLTVNVTFTTPFSSVPVVVVSAQFSNTDTSCTYSAYSVTTSGFTIRGAGNPAGNVAWIATNAGNA